MWRFLIFCLLVFLQHCSTIQLFRYYCWIFFILLVFLQGIFTCGAINARATSSVYIEVRRPRDYCTRVLFSPVDDALLRTYNAHERASACSVYLGFLCIITKIYIYIYELGYSQVCVKKTKYACSRTMTLLRDVIGCASFCTPIMCTVL